MCKTRGLGEKSESENVSLAPTHIHETTFPRSLFPLPATDIIVWLTQLPGCPECQMR